MDHHPAACGRRRQDGVAGGAPEPGMMREEHGAGLAGQDDFRRGKAAQDRDHRAGHRELVSRRGSL
ncbi:MAG: hypothetical protein ACKVYV_03995 [Limisphaerales bacterium]